MNYLMDKGHPLDYILGLDQYEQSIIIGNIKYNAEMMGGGD